MGASLLTESREFEALLIQESGVENSEIKIWHNFSEGPDAVMHRYENDKGEEVKDYIPYADCEVNEDSFVIRVLKKSKEIVDGHPKIVYVATGVTIVGGVATALAVRHHRHKTS